MNIDIIFVGVILSLVFLVSILFVLSDKIVKFAVKFTNYLFPLVVIITIVTLFFPQLFTSFASSQIEGTQTATTLKGIDESIIQVNNLRLEAGNFFDSIFNQGQTRNVEEQDSNIYSQFIEATATLLRLSVLIISIIILIFLTYIKLVFVGTSKIDALEKEVNKLKKQLEIDSTL